MKNRIKHALSSLALALLGVIEIFLMFSALPPTWQERMLPTPHDQWSITHPALGQEIEQAFRHHIWIAITYYSLILVLLTVNTALIRWLSRTRRSL
jgi:hypothetical protein